MQEYIEIKNAKVHNLKNVSLKIPKNKFVVFTGVSGSGKSSLAFDTLYAEGQRRYVESLSSYARQFLGLMEKPDVESITGLSPAISIDQKTSSTNPRSTVGTVTEIYDYLRLLYARIGQPHCPICGSKIEAQPIDDIVKSIISEIKQLITDNNQDVKIQIIAPLIQQKKGIYTELFSRLLSKGFIRVIVDGEAYTLEEAEKLKLKKYEKHDIDLVVDRLIAPKNDLKIEDDKDFNKRLRDAVELSSNMADGEIAVILDETKKYYSEKNNCPTCKLSFPQLSPISFSFNSPQGACTRCDGLGFIRQINLERIFNPRLTILEGGIFPWSQRTTTYETWSMKILQAVADHHGFSLSTPIGNYSQETFDLIFYGKGAEEKYTVEYKNKYGMKRFFDTKYEGVVPQLERRYAETQSEYIRTEIEKYLDDTICPECKGERLKPYILAVTVGDKNINQITNLPINESISYLDDLKLTGIKEAIAQPILKEIKSRITFLNNVGLGYLALSRRANTLSGGESQRIRLASQIGTGLTGVLYVLDEPSIGLHARDVSKLVDTLFELKDLGNTIIVVEHDKETIERAEWIVDVGPLAGTLGGKIVAEGTIDEVKQTDTISAKYLSNSLCVGDSLNETSQLINTERNSKNIIIHNARTHNLKQITTEIPLGKFVCITGVSGSGKSSLINDTLYPALVNQLGNIDGVHMTEGDYDKIEGIENVRKVIGIDQSPIGRTPRSNPVTYTGIFNYIRDVFALTPEAKSRGYSSGRFSFNVKGGRCEKCKGEGQIKIEMQFLPDMYVTCDSCKGKRYNEDALQIDYKGKNISQVLEMTVSEALEFFKNIPQIYRKLELLEEVGLGYIKLGQPATTLSGGESQRIKLARELSKMTRGHTVYILDEPTTGLHFYDVDKLLLVLKRLVAKGNSVLVIEHNLDVVQFADWIVDLGPEGGDKGGEIIAEGTVTDIINTKNSYTGKYLKQHIESIRNFQRN